MRHYLYWITTDQQHNGADSMNAKQAREAIKELNNNGRSPAQILSAIVSNGGEWSDAVWVITDTLKLTPDEVEEMEADA